MSQPKTLPDDQLTELLALVIGAASAAHMFAYATSLRFREWVTSPECSQWAGFREKAEDLSRPYPLLRPMLGRFYLAIEALAAQGDQGCLPPETYGKLLFSDANPCHAPRCEVQKLADEIQQVLLRLHAAANRVQ
jgi:hypothetical protein